VREATTICPAPCKLTSDHLTLKVVSESRVTWATSVPILVYLGLSVLNFGPMYATDRCQTDVTSASLFNAPYGWGHNNNNQIYTAPHGHNFRGAGGRSDQCSVKAWEDSKVLSLDLKTELLIRTVCGSEFHRDDAENRKARPEKSALVNGWTSSGMADER